jgi:N-carbamoylputrescine amidase
VAANRVGVEVGSRFTLEFYGSSFVAGPTGDKIVEADRTSEVVLTTTFDLDEVAILRRSWGVFRDRRTDLY